MRTADADPESFINTYPSSQERFIRNYCGYDFTRAENTDEIKRNKTFIGMNTYPGAGSIKIINNTIVVKFSDP